ncbi:MAG: sigma-70 family RNA polymerase sigma factor [Flavipsychrobacter sp.]
MGVPDTYTIDEQVALAECRKGSRMAQKFFYDKYVDSMLLLCIRYVKDHEDAKEACMDGFYNFFKNIDKFEWQGEGSISAWLKKIVVNQCLMHLRKKKDLIIASDDMNVYEGVAVDISALDTMAAKEIISLIQELPAGYRTVFNLYALEGKTHKEIAALLQISENTSKSQLHKAKTMLKEKIKLMY